MDQSNNINNNVHKITRSYSLSNEDLATQQHQQQVYYTPPYSRVIPIENTINEEDYNFHSFRHHPPSIQQQQQQQQFLARSISPGIIQNLGSNSNNNGGILSSSPTHTISSPLSIKRTSNSSSSSSHHKRSNSHGLPPKSILHHSPPNNINGAVTYLSPVSTYSSNGSGGQQQYSIRSTPHSPNILLSPTILPTTTSTSTTTTLSSSTISPTPPFLQQISSPTIIKKRIHRNISQTMDGSVGGSSITNSSGSVSFSPIQQQQTTHHDSPPASPRLSSSNNEINHRRAVSWEPPLQGKPLEALSQIIKEKKEALIQRERELMQKQKQLEQEFIQRRDISTSSPPSVQQQQPSPQVQSSPSIPIPIQQSSSTSLPHQQIYSQSPNSGCNSNPIQFIISPNLISSTSPIPIQQPIKPILKHNRSKSDTNTFIKLQQQQQQPSQILTPKRVYPTSTVYSPSNGGYSQTMTSSTTTTTTPNVFSPNPSYQPSSSSSKKYHHEKSKSAQLSSPKINSILLTQILQQHQLQQLQQQQHAQQQQQQYHVHPIPLNNNSNNINNGFISNNKAPRRKSIDPLAYISLNSHLQSLNNNNNNFNINNNYNNNNNFNVNNNNNKTFKNPVTVQFLNSLQTMNMNIDEFEEELDKEIQQVILQTKNIQGKMDLLERVRCTAPDPLLMLFGENCKNVIDKKYNHHNSNNQNNNSNIQPTTTTTTQTSIVIQSPHLAQVINNGGIGVGGNVVNSSPVLLSMAPQQQSNKSSPSIMSPSILSPTLYSNYHPTFQDTRPQCSITTRTSRKPTTSASLNSKTSRCPDKSKSKNLNPMSGSSGLVPRSSAFSPPPRMTS